MNSPFDLFPLDLKIYISSFDINTWIRFSFLDNDFYKYSSSKEGIINFYSLFTKIYITKYGAICKLFGKLHRNNDLPAIIYLNGDQVWYINGKLHRNNDKPAIIYSNGTQEWYKNGELHRDNDLPAIIYSNGEQHWYKNGELHRENDKPAIIFSSGTQKWYKNGKLHRDNIKQLSFMHRPEAGRLRQQMDSTLV